MDVKKNIVYSIIYEFIIAFYPIIILPYVSYALGTKGIGIYSYTSSVLGYFLLLCQLGVTMCGARAISQNSADLDSLSKTFWNIYIIQLVASSFSVILYIIYIIFLGKDFLKYYLLLLPFLFGQGFRCSWFFVGIGQVKAILTRNIFVRALSGIFIILFIKDYSNLKIYFLIMSTSYLLGELSVWPYIIKKLKKVSINWNETKIYIMPMIKMFIPILALRGYFYIDEMMLEHYLNVRAVGIYENAYKLVSMPLQIYVALSSVMTARASLLVKQKKFSENIKSINMSLDISGFFMIPLMFGLSSIADKFVPWYMGVEFADSAQVLKIMVPIIVLSGISNILRTQYLIPFEKDNAYVITVLIGTFSNILLNGFLIPQYGYVGAAVGTLVTEMIITLLTVGSLKLRIIDLNGFRNYLLYIISGFLMNRAIDLLTHNMKARVTTYLLQMIFGVLIYVLCIFLFQKFLFKNKKKSIYKQFVSEYKKIRNKIK